MKICFVVIGRNEGDRLVHCLESLMSIASTVVYVDSGSTDGSVEFVRRKGISVVELDLRVPFTAGRARNVGVEYLRRQVPDLEYIQFIDGDCELSQGWIKSSVEFLNSNPGVAVVSGRIHERYPDSSIYNLLCDIEWNRTAGETNACFGIALVRINAFQNVDGFRDDLIAGEEPELCFRLRKNGWKIWDLNEHMAIHDAAMTSIGQWWTRVSRGGYAFAEGVFLHGSSPDYFRVRESLRAWVWGFCIPLCIMVLVILFGVWGLAFVAVYPLQVIRLGLSGNIYSRKRWLYSLFLVLGKFPEMFGQIKFLYNKIIGRRGSLIEYK